MTKQARAIYDVFISYAAADRAWVWEWLVPRLKDAGLQVCTDRETFDVGVPLVVNQERAIQQSRHTLLIITPAWTESAWADLEAVMTQTLDPASWRSRMIPLLVEPCTPPLRIAMLAYADFTHHAHDEQQFERILDAVRGKRRLADFSLPLGRLLYGTADAAPDVGRHILSFDALIADKTDGFEGRQFLFRALEQFQEEEPSGYCVIRGEPGIGKTAFMGQLVKKRAVVHHFNLVQQNICSADQFLKNVCAQLIARYELTRLAIPDQPMQDSALLVRCLQMAAADVGNRPLILAIDALDEAEWRTLPPRVNVHYLPPSLPEGVYIVVSTRPDERMPLEIARRRDIDLVGDSKGNLIDIRRYLELYAQRDKMRARLMNWRIDTSTFVAELEGKSQGNFMYLHYVLPAIAAGDLGRGGIGELPLGLQGYYRSHWETMRKEIGNHFGKTHERVICVLAIMTEPVGLDAISEWSGLPLGQVKDIAVAWRQFLDKDVVDGEDLYRIYHSSFAEFLGKQVDLRAYSRLVARAIHAKVERGRRGK